MKAATSPVVAAATAERERMARELEAADLRAVMGTAEGRRFMWRLLGRCGFLSASFNHSGSIMAFNEGRRGVALELFHEIEQVCPEQYLAMQGEAIEAARKAAELALLDNALDQEDENNG